MSPLIVTAGSATSGTLGFTVVTNIVTTDPSKGSLVLGVTASGSVTGRTRVADTGGLANKVVHAIGIVTSIEVPVVGAGIDIHNPGINPTVVALVVRTALLSTIIPVAAAGKKHPS